MWAGREWQDDWDSTENAIEIVGMVNFQYSSTNSARSSWAVMLYSPLKTTWAYCDPQRDLSNMDAAPHTHSGSPYAQPNCVVVAKYTPSSSRAQLQEIYRHICGPRCTSKSHSLYYIRLPLQVYISIKTLCRRLKIRIEYDLPSYRLGTVVLKALLEVQLQCVS